MLYFFVRVAVYMLALLLTLLLLPGLHVDLNILADMSPAEFAPTSKCLCRLFSLG